MPNHNTFGGDYDFFGNVELLDERYLKIGTKNTFINELFVLCINIKTQQINRKHSENFKEKFHDHFDGELRLERTSRRDPTPTWKGTGGHNHSVIGEKIIVRRYLTEVINDMPFEALISVRNDTGNWIEKTAKSSMFPKNWDISRVKEEIALVYSKKVKLGEETNLLYENNKFSGKVSSENFEILIEVDKQGNITNAYPF